MSVNMEETVDSPPQSLMYEELMEVVTHAVAKLNIEWPAEKQDARPKSKLDENFLKARSQLSRRGLSFFPDLHVEVTRSWDKSCSSRFFSPMVSIYSNITGLNEKGYGPMPAVDLLKDLDDREKEKSDVVAELCWATDLLLQATNETARADLLLFGLSFHPALSRSVWMLRWLRCDSRASTYCITLTIV